MERIGSLPATAVLRLEQITSALLTMLILYSRPMEVKGTGYCPAAMSAFILPAPTGYWMCWMHQIRNLGSLTPMEAFILIFKPPVQATFILILREQMLASERPRLRLSLALFRILRVRPSRSKGNQMLPITDHRSRS